jgi:putative transposase
MTEIELRRASHCVYKIRYHMVMCLKYRKKLLHGEKVDFMKGVMKEIEARYYFEYETIGTDGDHVHIFVEAAPRYAPSRVMQVTKSITARELFNKYPKIKEQLWGGEFWSDGGYIGTVGGEVTADVIRNYIERHGTPEEKEGYKQMKIMDF